MEQIKQYALELVAAERQRQDDKWGDQSKDSLFERLAILGEEYGELCEAVSETLHRLRNKPERGGPDAIRREAIHVAAVAVSIVEAVTRQQSSEWGVDT